jgi:hypothetical protein
VRNRELVKLESDLLADIETIDPAIRSRLRERIREFIMWDIRSLPGCERVKDRKDIMSTIQTHGEADLLRRLVEKPREFSTKEMKELWRGTLLVEPVAPSGKSAATDPLAFLEELNVSDDVKAKIMGAMVEAVASEVKGEISGK